MARVLKQAGYATGMAGKWRQMRDTPGDWGFDEFLTDPSPSGYYWETGYTKNGAPLEAKPGTYGPDLCRDFAIDFFERHRDQPFFFYYPTHLVHNPIVRTPQSPDTSKDQDALYADNVAYLDKQVGELVGALDRLGLRERTIIVFASDNGTAKYGIEHAFIRGRHIYGMKETMFEGGSRVPLDRQLEGNRRCRPDLGQPDRFYRCASHFCRARGSAASRQPCLGRSQLRSADPGRARLSAAVGLCAAQYGSRMVCARAWLETDAGGRSL